MMLLGNGGCKTPERTALNTAGTIVYTVDAAMKAWAQFVHQGHATQAQEISVQVRYGQYQQAMDTAKVAMMIWVSDETQKAKWDIAMIELDQVKGKLLALINQIITERRGQ